MKPEVKPIQDQNQMVAKPPQFVPAATEVERLQRPVIPVKKKAKMRLRKVVLRIIVFNVVNVFLVVLILTLIGGLSRKANELKILKNEKILTQEMTDVAVLRADLNNWAVEIEKIKSVFVDEDNFLKFLDAKDQLQASGIVTDFSVSDKVVKDGNGNKGYALLIEFKGGVENVRRGLETLEKMPFLMRTASLDISILREENQVRVKYIGFLYVNE